MEVKVGKQNFKLERKNILISEMYSDLAQMAYDHADVESDIELAKADYDEAMELAESKLDEIRAKRKHILALKDIRKHGKERSDDMGVMRIGILEEILKINGYEYDADLWREQADTELVNDIIVELVGGGSKKKVT